MRILELERYGLPARIIESWHLRQGETLLPVQQRAIRAGLLESGSRQNHERRGMIIAAPTSSGKSFCAELAAVKALVERKKVVLLFPLKSLAEEKYRSLNELLAPLGISCLIATGDHPGSDAAFYKGDYQIAVTIYEKFDLLLSSRLESLATIGLVVVDELQMLATPKRGAVLERILTKIKAYGQGPSLIGLSAVLAGGGLSTLGEWLSAVVVEETVRPVDLLVGVAADKSVRYRSFNSGQISTTESPFANTADGFLDGLVDFLKADSGATLIFLKSRQNTVEIAFRLAAAVNFPPAKSALEQLRGEEPSFLVRSLSQALSRGVAFHNADLSSRQREIVEQAFAAGEVHALCATTTLAMGVNLPADTVILETVKYTGALDDNMALVPISRADFDNMTGRAGRLGLRADQPGQAIVLANSEFERDILWESYVAPSVGTGGDSALILSSFDSIPLEDWALSMVTCGLVKSSDDFERIYKMTLHALQYPAAMPDWSQVIRQLQQRQCLVVDPDDGRLAVTPSGKATAQSGITVRQSVKLKALINRFSPESAFGWIAVALAVPDWQLPPQLLTRSEHRENVPVKMLYQRFDHSVEEAVPLLPESHRRQPLSYRSAAALKALLLLHDWMSLVPVQKLEERYQLHLGQILSLGETAAHLVQGIALVIEAEDLESPNIAMLRDLAGSLRFGLPSNLIDLYKRVGDLLSRADLRLLSEAGLTTLADLSNASDQRLEEILHNPSKCQALKARIGDCYEEVSMKDSSLHPNAAGFAPESVEIDGSFEHDRYLIKINGFPVRLTGKSFKYFAKLAWWRRQQPAGWIYKDDIEIGFNQARYLYRMKNEINHELRADWPIVENNRLGYYRLDIDPGRIQINLDNLKNHPDYELRSLATVQ